VTITNKDGLNMWWYAVTLSVPSGVTVTSLKMKDSTMSAWEEGVSEWNYYKFTGNTPYSAPFHFKVTTNSGEYIGYNVISSITAGDSGSVSLSSAYTSDEGETKKTGMASGEVAAIVICSVLACCVFGGLCMLNKRKKVIVAGVEDETAGVTSGSAYDMSPVGDGQTTGDNEAHAMIEVQVTETNQ